MGLPIAGVLAVLALGLGVVSTGLNHKAIYNIEMDRSYVDAADRALMKARVEVENRQRRAEASRDSIAIAQAKELSDRLRSLQRRVKLPAVNRQVEQTKESFREEQWRQYLIDKVGIELGGSLLSRAGFGKVLDAYTRGSNWPPDPSKTFLTWDPTTKQVVRFVAPGQRPQFYAAIFEDDLEDAFKIVLSGYDAMATASDLQARLPTAEEALAAVREGLARMNVEALPDVIGEYLASALMRKVAAENPQILVLPEVEQAAFVCNQTRRQLQRMAADEADLDRSSIIRAAIDRLICPEPEDPSATAKDSSQPPKPDSRPAVAAKPDPLPWTYKGKGSNREFMTTRWGRASSATLADTPDIQVTLHPDGKAEAIVSITKQFRWYCDSSDPGRDGTLEVADAPATVRLTGTHADGEFALNFGGTLVLRGSYSTESITGSLRGQDTGKVANCGETISSLELTFTLDRAKSGEDNR